MNFVVIGANLTGRMRALTTSTKSNCFLGWNGGWRHCATTSTSKIIYKATQLERLSSCWVCSMIKWECCIHCSTSGRAPRSSNLLSTRHTFIIFERHSLCKSGNVNVSLVVIGSTVVKRLVDQWRATFRLSLASFEVEWMRCIACFSFCPCREWRLVSEWKGVLSLCASVVSQFINWTKIEEKMSFLFFICAIDSSLLLIWKTCPNNEASAKSERAFLSCLFIKIFASNKRRQAEEMEAKQQTNCKNHRRNNKFVYWPTFLRSSKELSNLSIPVVGVRLPNWSPFSKEKKQRSMTYCSLCNESSYDALGKEMRIVVNGDISIIDSKRFRTHLTLITKNRLHHRHIFQSKSNLTFQRNEREISYGEDRQANWEHVSRLLSDDQTVDLLSDWSTVEEKRLFFQLKWISALTHSLTHWFEHRSCVFALLGALFSFVNMSLKDFSCRLRDPKKKDGAPLVLFAWESFSLGARRFFIRDETHCKRAIRRRTTIELSSSLTGSWATVDWRWINRFFFPWKQRLILFSICLLNHLSSIRIEFVKKRHISSCFSCSENVASHLSCRWSDFSCCCCRLFLSLVSRFVVNENDILFGLLVSVGGSMSIDSMLFVLGLCQQHFLSNENSANDQRRRSMPS